jgi:protoporphyrinogen oxidase
MTTTVAVIGGGISGLASAVALADRGARVTVYESDAQLGGLGATFEYAPPGGKAVALEKFYHCILPGDAALLTLLEKVKIKDRIEWRDVGMGFMDRRAIYAMNGPLDLLRFSPLSLLDRLRLGRMGLHARRRGPSEELDGISVEDWICSLAGRNVYEKLFRALLESKLGEGAGRIPALWLASRIHREKNNNTERKGYIPGGYRAIVAAVVQYLAEKQVQFFTSTPVERLDLEGDGVVVRSRSATTGAFDRVVVAAPFIEFRRMAAALPLPDALRALELDYQGVVNCVFFLKKKLMDHYWMPIMNSGTRSQGVVELTNLVPVSAFGGLHVAYFLNYTHRAGELFRTDDAQLAEMYTNDLRTAFPHAADAVVDRRLFKAPFVEPIWPLHYRSIRPSPVAVPGKVYIATTAQVYPHINAWNSCCEVAVEMAHAFFEDLRPAAAEAGALRA